jgi:hypothetical protein
MRPGALYHYANSNPATFSFQCPRLSQVARSHKSTPVVHLPLEMAQERELQAWWPLDTMACGLDSRSRCSLFGWDPQLLFYFGQAPTGIGAGDSVADECHEHDILLAPKSRRRAAAASYTGLCLPCLFGLMQLVC